MYILVKILGIDHVKTRMFNTKDDALKAALDEIKIITDDSFNVSENTIVKNNGKIYIRIDDKDAYNCIEYVITKAKKQEEY